MGRSKKSGNESDEDYVPDKKCRVVDTPTRGTRERTKVTSQEKSQEEKESTDWRAEAMDWDYCKVCKHSVWDRDAVAHYDKHHIKIPDPPRPHSRGTSGESRTGWLTGWRFVYKNQA